SEAEVAYMLEQEGLPEASARHAAAELARSPNVLLKTMVEKELGLIVDEGGSPLQGALILAGAFAVAALIPIAPFFFLPVPVALVAAIAISVVVMFCLGVAKSRLTLRNPVRSGLEIVPLGAAATVTRRALECARVADRAVLRRGPWTRKLPRRRPRRGRGVPGRSRPADRNVPRRGRASRRPDHGLVRDAHPQRLCLGLARPRRPAPDHRPRWNGLGIDVSAHIAPGRR